MYLIYGMGGVRVYLLSVCKQETTLPAITIPIEKGAPL